MGAMGGPHDRMPVILNADEREAWLGGSDDVAALGAGAMLAHHQVARFGLRDSGLGLISIASPRLINLRQNGNIQAH